jgi:predicted RNA-binding Zn-ribbon protein involved in translation (DUF1610 family)
MSKDNEMRKAAEAFRDLCKCYRLGNRPSEALFARLEKANAILAIPPDPPATDCICDPKYSATDDACPVCYPATDEEMREKVRALIETVFGVAGVVRDRVADQFLAILRPSTVFVCVNCGKPLKGIMYCRTCSALPGEYIRPSPAKGEL